MTRPRLSLTTLTELGPLPAGVSGPAVDPRSVGVGIVHLGIGAFHRAHQAVVTEEAAAATGEDRWGILGVTGRSASVVQQLRPQDCLYGVLEKAARKSSLRLVGSVREVAWPGEESPRVVQALAAEATCVVTLTVTEKGYTRARDGSADLADPAVAADAELVGRELAGEDVQAASRTPIGLLTRGLARRFRTGGASITIVPCDNMVDNGRVTQRLVRSLAGFTGGDDGSPKAREAFLTWLEESVAFPSTMVDRIAPATTDAHRQEAAAMLGLSDAGLVVAEPFLQWVVQDRFAAPRPAWERAGATLTDDVAPYEQVKLRLLNATHSLLAYLGALKGHATIAAAVADPELERAARDLMDCDVIPTITPPPGLDLAGYRDSVLERFANPSTGHTTIQVAMDGSQKLPIRLLGTVSDRLAAGAVPQAAALAVAAWMVFVARGRSTSGRELPLDDPLAERLRSSAADGTGSLAERLLAVSEVFPDDVAGNDAFRDAVSASVRELDRALG